MEVGVGGTWGPEPLPYPSTLWRLNPISPVLGMQFLSFLSPCDLGYLQGPLSWANSQARGSSLLHPWAAILWEDRFT